MHWLQLHSPLARSAVQDFHAVSRAASTPRTSFWQSFLKALLMSSPLTFFIHAALAFEVLLYFHHPLSSPHASTTTGLQHVDQGKWLGQQHQEGRWLSKDGASLKERPWKRTEMICEEAFTGITWFTRLRCRTICSFAALLPSTGVLCGVRDRSRAPMFWTVWLCRLCGVDVESLLCMHLFVLVLGGSFGL